MKYVVLVLSLFCVSVVAQTIDERPPGYILLQGSYTSNNSPQFVDIDSINDIYTWNGYIRLNAVSSGNVYYHNGTYEDLLENISQARSEKIGTTSTESSFSMTDLANGMLAASQAFADYFNNK